MCNINAIVLVVISAKLKQLHHRNFSHCTNSETPLELTKKIKNTLSSQLNIIKLIPESCLQCCMLERRTAVTNYVICVVLSWWKDDQECMFTASMCDSVSFYVTESHRPVQHHCITRNHF